MDSVLVFLIFVIWGVFWIRESQKLFYLYSKKYLNFPSMPKDLPTLLVYSQHFPISPFKAWKIVFQRHKDKEINTAANRVRLLFLIFFLMGALDMFILSQLWKMGY
jgi:hypothetical protein